MRGLGSSRPLAGELRWCTRADRPVEPLYRQLKEQRILVRYMNYPGWGDGLRITVGDDGQIDALLGTLKALVASG